jgi:hypothetical protein
MKWVKVGSELTPEEKASIAREYLRYVLDVPKRDIGTFEEGFGSLGNVWNMPANLQDPKGEKFWSFIGKDYSGIFTEDELEDLKVQDKLGVGAWLMLVDWHLSLPNTPIIGRMVRDAHAFK